MFFLFRDRAFADLGILVQRDIVDGDVAAGQGILVKGIKMAVLIHFLPDERRNSPIHKTDSAPTEPPQPWQSPHR